MIFVDGVRFDNTTAQQASGNPRAGIAVGGQDFSRLNDLNAEDIANVEVLKGPAASALYGTAAANGVLLITTKRGISGRTVWRVYAEGGTVEDKTDYPDVIFTYQRNAQGPAIRPDGQINDVSFDNVVTSCPNRIAATGTCRQDETIRFNNLKDPRTTPFSTGNRSKFGVNVAGGNDAMTFFLSADKEDEQGVISYNTVDKTSLRANFTANLSPKADLRLTSGYTASDVQQPGGDNNIFGPLIGGLLGSPAFLGGPDGVAPGAQFAFGLTNEDIANFAVGQGTDRFVAGLSGNYRPFAWLTANGNTGLDYYSQASTQTVQPGRIPIGSPFDEGFRDSRSGRSFLYTANVSATGTYRPRENLVSTTTVGGNYQRDHSTLVTCFGAGIVTGSSSCSASTSLFAVTENFYEVITVGGLVQQQLALNDRLFFSASARGDDNSAFGSDFGFIVYPAASLSWVVSEEPFFPRRFSFLDNLRLRTAFGTSGLTPAFRQAQFLSQVVSVQDETSEVAAVTVRSVGNEELKPERTTEYELGFDAGLLENRVSLEFTYFDKRSKDALIARDLAPSYGLTSDDVNSGLIFDNLGEVRNRGTEVGVNVNALRLPRAQLNLRLTATTVRNKIVDLGAGVDPIPFGRAQQHVTGYPAGSFFQRPYTYSDPNGDGKLTANDVTFDNSRQTVLRLKNEDGTIREETIPEVYLGSSLPTNSQSVSAQLTLFNFVTLSTLFDRRAGFKQQNETESFRCSTGDARRNSNGQGGCVATGDPNASLDEQARFIASRFLGTRAGYIEDGRFVKWREFAVSVGLPQRFVRSVRGIEGATLTLAGRNLKTWTNYTGLDPEANESGGDTNFSQNEFNTQPPVRYFTARLELTF
jgi:TonB-dependent SusC/RagA subfamily outer membrane receptor